MEFIRREQPERLAQAELDVVGTVVVYRNRDASIEPLQPSRHGQRVLGVDMRAIFHDLGQQAATVAELRPAPRVLIDPEVRGARRSSTGPGSRPH